MSSKIRPTGITILVILEVISAIILLVFALALMAFSGFIYQYIPPSQLPPELFSSIMVFGGALFVIGSIIVFLVAWGLWTGKKWAWYIAFIFAILGALGGLFSLPSGIVGLIIDGLIIWYLWQPNVKAFFSMGAPTPTMASPPPPPSQPSTTSPTNVVYCSKCGTANPIENRFCKSCGNDLKAPA
jgi:hypothetical protein